MRDEIRRAAEQRRVRREIARDIRRTAAALVPGLRAAVNTIHVFARQSGRSLGEVTGADILRLVSMALITAQRQATSPAGGGPRDLPGEIAAVMAEDPAFTVAEIARQAEDKTKVDPTDRFAAARSVAKRAIKEKLDALTDQIEARKAQLADLASKENVAGDPSDSEWRESWRGEVNADLQRLQDELRLLTARRRGKPGRPPGARTSIDPRSA